MSYKLSQCRQQLPADPCPLCRLRRLVQVKIPWSERLYIVTVSLETVGRDLVERDDGLVAFVRAQRDRHPFVVAVERARQEHPLHRSRRLILKAREGRDLVGVPLRHFFRGIDESRAIPGVQHLILERE